MRVITDRSIARRWAAPCAWACAASLTAALLIASCSQGSHDSSGDVQAPPPTSTVLTRDQDAPGIVVTITAVRGATGPKATFRAGDRIAIDYTLKKRDGSAWGVGEMTVARILVSGPTFNYQRVIAEQTDVKARSSAHGSGAFTYRFEVPIPSTYLPPLNSSGTFGPLDGVLAGQPLLQGTYTVGLTFAWDYTVATLPFRDAGETTADFLLGDSAVFAPREVVTQANCDQCHVSMRVHQGVHRDVKLCMLCHTSGAEDANIPTVDGGTPGVLVDSRVLFHKIHNGAYLPSVVGVGVGPLGGSPVYDAVPQRYVVVDADGVEHDYSNTGSPVWPSRTIPMPRDLGYDALPAEAKARDDQVRRGLVNCDVCHGDPDGPGPLAAPAHGDIAYAQPTRRACGSCHDDVQWDKPYDTNQVEMIEQPDDSHCTICHGFIGGPLSVVNAHRHPLVDTIFVPHAPFEAAFSTGLNFDLQNLVEAGVNDADGTIDSGEKVQVTFGIHDDAGAPIHASTLASIRAVISGPTTNSNLVLDAQIPPARLVGAPPYTTTLPQRVLLELVGHSTAAPNEVFTTRLAPHWHIIGAPTVVEVRVGLSGVASSIPGGSTILQNFVDVGDGTGFARDDVIVIEDGIHGLEEYIRVQFVDGNRLWFSSPSSPAYAPGLHFDHTPGATVAVVVLQLEHEGADYTLDAATGRITEHNEFGAGNAVLVDYTTDFIMPVRYPFAANASSDLDESCGKWTGKHIVSGTYRLGLSGSFDTVFFAPGQQTTYTIASTMVTRDFLVGSAQTIEPYALVSSGANCNACHQDLWFHEGKYRGFDACILCHAAAGAEDQPQYVAANAPPTPGVTVNFRQLLHSISNGAHLANASTFTAVDASSQPYPDNFSAETFSHVVFPAEPGGTMQCAKCHGDSNTAWIVPAPRDHPTEQSAPVLVWKAGCIGCHDSTTTAAHIAKQTSPAGVEACVECHGPGTTLAVELVHKAR